MIYLVDDKVIRQEKDFNWSKERLSTFSDYLKPISNAMEINLIPSSDNFEKAIVILFHESFHDAKSSLTEIELLKSRIYSELSENVYVGIFSGSKFARVTDGNRVYLPVSVVYKNLDKFIQKYAEGIIDLKYLLYGDNPDLEETLHQLRETAISKSVDEKPAIIEQKENFFARTTERIIRNPINNYDDGVIKNYFTDQDISRFILDHLSNKKYQNIFLPLCYGNCLSDFNGLRLASHIRCTPGTNQLTRIFIYGFVGIESLIDHENFNILKTKNVKLISFSKNDFEKFGSEDIIELQTDELYSEISKLKLDVPLNYEDNHSISNEWAILLWYKFLGAENDFFVRKDEINSILYYKYLKIIYNIEEIKKTPIPQLYKGKNLKANVLLIDDDINKGWFHIFNFILLEKNNIPFFSLDYNFKDNDRKSIIDFSLSYINDNQIDVVLLDLRLHELDKIETDFYLVTGFQILKEIKKLNPGIQVIVFTATNNSIIVGSLLENGADDVFIKEGPYLSYDLSVTERNIVSFLESLWARVNKSYLTRYYSGLDLIRQKLNPRKIKTSENPLPKKFVDETLRWLEFSYLLLNKKDSSENRAAAFFFLFTVLENISNRIIDTDFPQEVPGVNNQRMYIFEFRNSNKKLVLFKENSGNTDFYDRTNIILKSARNLSWKQKILNTIDYITGSRISEEELSHILKKRNDLVHANSTTGEKVNIDLDIIDKLNSIIFSALPSVP